MKKTIKTLAVLLGIALLTGGNAFAAKKKVIRIGSANGGGTRKFQGIVAVAQYQKYFEEEFAKYGYSVEYITFENGIALNEGFLANEVEFGFIGDVPGVTGLSNNIGTQWIGSDLGIATLGVAVPNNSTAKTAKDFIGKTVAVNIGTNAHLLYGKFFDDGGVKYDQFNTVNLTLANAATAVITGDADAAIGDVTALLPLEQKGELKVIFTTIEKPEWASQLFFIGRKKFLDKNPDLGKAFFKAVIRAKQDVEKDLPKFYGVISADALADYPEIAHKLYTLPNQFTIGVTDEQISRAQSLHDYFLSIGRINGNHDVRNFVNNSYYEKAAKELGVK